ncbi:consortin-like [Anneissia japonica]|uniref:consortin-like n=1 Tax=Anneissia japonica TaxID=1529436 RepID=UPI0014257AF6|nr:consortin-like [Anneissia japonica]XP_033125862.1 consortin-like [Anneissia japonica]
MSADTVENSEETQMAEESDNPQTETSDAIGQSSNKDNVNNKHTENLTNSSRNGPAESSSSQGIEETNSVDENKSEREISRSDLFKRGQALEQEGKQDEALKLYLQSLTGIQQQTSFPELPLCLHHVSQIYFNNNEYEKAVHFIQAEKLFYETALIDAAKLHLQLKNAQEGTSREMLDVSSEAVKAEQFENLARLCKEEGNPQLALDYCGKATKMYRQLYGEDHPTTKQALDLFTIIYAEVGKNQYAEAMERSQSEEESSEKVHKILPRLSGDAIPGGPKGTLKKRSSFDSKEKSDERKKRGLKKVRFEEEYEPTPIKDQDDVVMTFMMMILFVLITIFIALIGSYVYCYDKTATSSMCASLKSDLSYYFMKIQYTFKHYFQ